MKAFNEASTQLFLEGESPTLNCSMFQTKMLHQYVKDSFAAPSLDTIKIFQMSQKNCQSWDIFIQTAIYYWLLHP